MEFVFFVGVFVIFCFVVCVVGALLYLLCSSSRVDVATSIAITAVLLILFIDVVFSVVLTGFIFSPEDYGYTKIQTESEANINEYRDN